MGWFTDLLKDLVDLFLIDYRNQLLQVLIFLLLFLFRKKLGEIADSLERNFKDNAVKIVVSLIAILLFLTLDDPFFFLDSGRQFFIALVLILIVYYTYIRKGADYIYDKKIRTV